MKRMRWWEIRRHRRAGREGPNKSGCVDATVVEAAVALVVQDLVTTGWTADRALPIVRTEAGHVAGAETLAGKGVPAVALALAENTQQLLHDSFRDTTWPTCPAHPRHPLWLHPDGDDLPVWRCPASGTEHGRLGDLHDPGGSVHE